MCSDVQINNVGYALDTSNVFFNRRYQHNPGKKSTITDYTYGVL